MPSLGNIGADSLLVVSISGKCFNCSRIETFLHIFFEHVYCMILTLMNFMSMFGLVSSTVNTELLFMSFIYEFT